MELEINVSKKNLFLILGGIVIASLVFVAAQVINAPVPGHTSSQINVNIRGNNLDLQRAINEGLFVNASSQPAQILLRDDNNANNPVFGDEDERGEASAVISNQVFCALSQIELNDDEDVAFPIGPEGGGGGCQVIPPDNENSYTWDIMGYRSDKGVKVVCSPTCLRK